MGDWLDFETGWPWGLMCSYLLQVDSPQLGQDEGVEEGTHVDHRGLALLSEPCQDHLGAGEGEGAGEKERVQVKERLQEQEQECRSR